MGFLRFFLASLVLVSHMDVTVQGLNPGVVAVVTFYLLAGQVVCRLWERQSRLAFGKRLAWFYRDRFWRIAPMYGFVLTVGLGPWLLGANAYFLSASPGVTDWLNNLSVIPLNYYMFNGADRFTLLPPAWSLAAELQFYILVPFLLAKTWRLWLAGCASLAVFTLAQTPLLNTDVFGYRLLAGVGFIFIIGGWIPAGPPRPELRLRQRALVGLWLGLAVYVALLYELPAWRQPYNMEVALGLVLGLPAVAVLSRWKPKGALHRAQRLAGALSYGVFLAHFPVIWLLELWRPALSESVPAVITGSTLVALAGHRAVEQPLWARHRATLARSPQHGR